MKALQHTTWLNVTVKLAGIIGAVWFVATAAHAESLFHASANYNTRAQAEATPRSIYFNPRAERVGDIIIVKLNETSIHQVRADMRLTKSQEVSENGTSIINNAVSNVLGRFDLSQLPLVGRFLLPTTGQTIANNLALPSVNGLANENETTTQAQVQRQNTYTQTVACQVVERLPNGYLVIQGHKLLHIDKEQQDLVLRGIVNPINVNQNNEVDSQYVANLQLQQAGRGVVSRQQGDGLVNKIYQFLY